MKQQNHSCGARNAMRTQCQSKCSSLTSPLLAAPWLSSRSLAKARLRSSSARNLASAGVCGIVKKQRMPKSVVMMPSTMLERQLFPPLGVIHDAVRLTEKDPGPPVVTVEADLREARREEPAERAGQRRGAVEVADAAEHLVALVEHGEVDDDAAEEATLKGAQEQPRDYKPGQGLGEAQERGDDSPGRDERW